MYEERDETDVYTAWKGIGSFNQFFFSFSTMSLPPFAQAFSMNSLALPPIDVVGKKRSRNSAPRDDEDPSDSESVNLLFPCILISIYIFKVQIFG